MEVRNPKLEIRMNDEVRMANSDFVIRVSFGLRASDFGLLPWISESNPGPTSPSASTPTRGNRISGGFGRTSRFAGCRMRTMTSRHRFADFAARSRGRKVTCCGTSANTPTATRPQVTRSGIGSRRATSRPADAIARLDILPICRALFRDRGCRAVRSRRPGLVRQLREGPRAATAQIARRASRSAGGRLHHRVARAGGPTLDDLDALTGDSDKHFVVFLDPPSLNERITNQFARCP